MRVIEKNVYNFNELKEEIQKKLIEQEIQEQNELYCQNCLYEDLKEEATRLLKKYFKNNADLKQLYYDLSYSQGDGAMFEFYLIYYNKDVTIKHYGHYTHERSFTIENYDLTDKQYDFLKAKIINMFEEFTKTAYKLAYYYITEEEAIEILSENEYFENGEIYL